MPEPDKDFFRKYLTRKQCFALLNVILVAGLILTGRLEFTVQSIACAIITFAIINTAAYFSLRYYPNWK
jgi:hypothetical protein